MVFGLGKRKLRPPHECVDGAVEAVQQLRSTSKDEKAHKKNVEDLDRCFYSIKCHLFGDEDHETSVAAASAVASAAVRAGLLEVLAQDIDVMEFEHRKDAAYIFGAVVRMKETEPEYEGARYVEGHPQIVEKLLQGYENNHVAIACGSMLRDCMRHPTLAAVVLSQESFWELFRHMENPAFEIASDAFSTFKESLTKHPAHSAPVVMSQLDRFIEAYLGLLRSDNYVVKRQSLHLLGDLLGLPEYSGLMLRIINRLDCLMLVMNLLRDPLRHIAYEAFVVFKSFLIAHAAGRLQEPAVEEVLRRNRDKLIAFVGGFQLERDAEDEDFREERELVKNIIRRIPAFEAEGSAEGGSQRASGGVGGGSPGAAQAQGQGPGEVPRFQ